MISTSQSTDPSVGDVLKRYAEEFGLVVAESSAACPYRGLLDCELDRPLLITVADTSPEPRQWSRKSLHRLLGEANLIVLCNRTIAGWMASMAASSATLTRRKAVFIGTTPERQGDWCDAIEKEAPGAAVILVNGFLAFAGFPR